MDELSPKREIKQGRRAGNLFQAGGSRPTASTEEPTPTETSSSPRPMRRQGGWADEVRDKKKGQNGDDNDDGKGKEDDERLRKDTTVILDNDDDDIPIIPDLDEVQEDDMANQISAPPSVQVTRVATYKELDYEFEKHAGIMTLDGGIDLKLLGSVLSPEADIMEEDKVWEWDRIYTEVSSDLRTEWEAAKGIMEKE